VVGGVPVEGERGPIRLRETGAGGAVAPGTGRLGAERSWGAGPSGGAFHQPSRSHTRSAILSGKPHPPDLDVVDLPVFPYSGGGSHA
jgi:hypothetical protein